MKELQKIKLGELVDFQTGPFGTQFSASEYVNEGIPVINVKNIGVGMVIRENLDYISEQTRDRLSQHILKTGDIVFGRKGSVDRHAYIFQNENGWVQGSDCIRARKKTQVNMLFLSQYLEGNGVKKQIINAAVGSTMPSLNTDILKDVIVLLPNIEEQNRISEVLKKIDDKICLNSKINDNLEQQIKTIFTFQFLQNANTEWKQQSLAELSEMYQPKTISGKDLIADGNYFVYGANGIIGKYNQYNHSESEIAVACRGASCGSIQMTLPFSWITGNAMVVKPHSDFPYREYLYYYLLAKNPNYLCSGSAQPQLTRENLTLYSLKVPSITELNAFESYAKKVRKIIIKNQQENIEFSTLRDWLLPMLMNGQATISD